MSTPVTKRKDLRRSSIKYYGTAKEHVDNEMKHEKLLTESSKLSSSWASFNLKKNDRDGLSEENYSSHSSTNSSPAVHRPNSFNGPLMVSVTCPNSSLNLGTSCLSPRIRTSSSSCHPSPCASPTNRISQVKQQKRNIPGFPSPLYESRKRPFMSFSNDISSSAEISYESSPEPSSHQKMKITRQDSETLITRWPPSSPIVSNFTTNHTGSLTTIGQSSPSVISLPSPRLSNCSNTTNSSPFPNNGFFENDDLNENTPKIPSATNDLK